MRITAIWSMLWKAIVAGVLIPGCAGQNLLRTTGSFAATAEVLDERTLVAVGTNTVIIPDGSIERNGVDFDGGLNLTIPPLPEIVLGGHFGVWFQHDGTTNGEKMVNELRLVYDTSGELIGTTTADADIEIETENSDDG